MDRRRGPGPTLRAQWLGHQLRDLREVAGLTLKDAGDYVQRDASTISRMEAGVVPPRAPDVLMLCNLYGVDDAQLRDALDQLSRDVWRKGWWEGFSDSIAGGFVDHAWLETRAHTIRPFEALVVPGLLQTEEYARAAIQAVDPDVSAEQMKRWVEFRMQRQCVLAQEQPPQVAAILDEAVLRRSIGGPDVMRPQLTQLAGTAQRPSVEIRVLPFHAEAHASPYGAFELFEMADPFPNVAYTQTLAGAIYVESEEVARFATAYDRLAHNALGPQESIALISAIAEDS